MEYEFGELLRAKRETVGLTQGQLAQALNQRLTNKNYSKVAISKWEHHYSTPRPAVIEALEAIIGTPAGLLLNAAGYYEQAETKRQQVVIDQLKRYIKEQFKLLAAANDLKFRDIDTGEWIVPTLEDKVKVWTEHQIQPGDL